MTVNDMLPRLMFWSTSLAPRRRYYGKTLPFASYDICFQSCGKDVLVKIHRITQPFLVALFVPVASLSSSLSFPLYGAKSFEALSFSRWLVISFAFVLLQSFFFLALQ